VTITVQQNVLTSCDYSTMKYSKTD